TVSYSGMASVHRRCARSTWPLAKCAYGLLGDAAKACSLSPFARSRSAAAEAVKPLSTRPASALAIMLCASTERGSSANASSNRLMPSEFRRCDTGFVYAGGREEYIPERRDARLGERLPQRQTLARP